MLVLLLATSNAFAQGASISGQAVGSTGKPVAFGAVRVCAYTGGGLPCSPLSLVFSDLAMAHQISNPVTTDQFGNYSFFVAPATYIVQITAAPGSVYSYQVTAASGSGGGGGGSPGGANLQLQFNNAGTAFGGLAGFTDSATKQALTLPATNYVQLKANGQVTNGTFPYQAPFTFIQNSDRINGLADAVASRYGVLNMISGWVNTPAQTMNYSSDTIRINSWTPAQNGGSRDTFVNCFAAADCVGNTLVNYGRGGSRQTDESIRGHREFSGIVNDYAGGLATLGAVTAQGDQVINNVTANDGHSFNFYEQGFLINVSQRWSAPGDVTNLTLCTDTRYGCITAPGTFARYTASTQTTLTAPVDSKVYSGTCPTHTDTGLLYPQAGNNIGGGNGFITDPKGAGTPQANVNYVNAPGGALVGYCATAASTAGMSAGTVVFISDSDYTFEFTKVISVVDGTHFTAFMHGPHATGANVSFGGGVGYAIGMDADIVPAGQLTTIQNPQYVTQRLAFPITKTSSGDAVQVWLDSEAGGGEILTRGFSGNIPKVSLTMAATISAGAITTLTGNFTSGSYNDYSASAGTQGVHVLPPPVVTVSTDCAVPPVIGFTASVQFSTVTRTYTPYIVSGGTGGCTTATFTIAGTAPNKFSTYPMTYVLKSEDPNAANVYDAVLGFWIPDGNFITPALAHPSDWAAGNLIEQPRWWKLASASSVQGLYSDPLNSESRVSGPASTYQFRGISDNREAIRIDNTEPSRDYYGVPPNYGVPVNPGDATHTGAYAITTLGEYLGGFHMSSPPMVGNGYPLGGDVIHIDCGSGPDGINNIPPCINGVFPTFNLFATHLGGSSHDISMVLNPATGDVALNANSLTVPVLNATQFNVPTVTLGTATSGPGVLNFARAGVVYDKISLCNPNGTGNYLGVGNCNISNNGAAPDGTIAAGDIEGMKSATFNGLSASLGYPTGIVNPVYTGTAGTNSYQYFLTALSPAGQEGIISPWTVSSSNPVAPIPLDGSHFFTLTCPTALQYGYPGGTTYILYGGNNTPGPPLVLRRLGTCPIGGTVNDTGAGTVVPSLPLASGNATIEAGGVIIDPLGSLRFRSSIYAGLTGGVSSPSAGILQVDGVTAGDGLGAIQTTTQTMLNGAARTTFARAAGGSNFTRTSPNAAPGATSVEQVDTSGNVTYLPVVPQTLGTATLVAGTVTVSTSAAAAVGTVNYILQHCGVGASTAIGTLSVGTIVNGTSFVINSLTATNTVATGDVSLVCWEIN